MLLDNFKFSDQLPCACFWKDLDSKYIYANNFAINTMKLEHYHYIGKDDNDMPWSNNAALYREQDVLSQMSNQGKFWVDMPERSDGTKTISLHKKTPFYNDDGKMSGVFGVGYIVDIENYYHLPSLLKCAGFQFSDFMILEKKEYCYHSVEFSKRQAQIISYMLRGFSTELTAKVLALSKRTVEFYFENLKDKLGCNSRSEVVQKAFQFNFIDLMFMKEF